MEHAQQAEPGTEAFGIAGQILHRPGAGTEEQVQRELLVGADEPAQLFGHGEGDQEVRQRIVTTIFDFMAVDPNETVLAVSHGAACRQFMRHWAHTSEVDQKEPLRNCCVLKFAFDGNEFRLLEIINHDFSAIAG